MTIQNVICDIDGVLMHDNVAVPGAAEFLNRIMEKGMPRYCSRIIRHKLGKIWQTVLPRPV